MVNAKGEVHLIMLEESMSNLNLDKETEDILYDMGKKCLRPKDVGDDLCEKAFWFHKCWKTADPKVSQFEIGSHVWRYLNKLFAWVFAALLPHVNQRPRR